MATTQQVTAGIYTRLSQNRDGKSPNHEIQEADGRKLADQLGVLVHDVYRDDDISASKFGKKRRPDYDRLLGDLRAGVLQMVITQHPSRLHRRPMELEGYIDISEKHGVITHSVYAGRWDLSTAAGRMQARIMANVDAYESEVKSERIKSKRQAQAALGAFHGGRRPYGYAKDGIQIVEEEAAVIRAVVDSVVMWTRRGPSEYVGPADISLRYLVRDLNRRGIPTAMDGKWTSNALKTLVMSPRIAGLSSYKGEIVATKAAWEPIVEMDTWRAACATLGDESRRTGDSRGGTVKWLGSGLYVCGICKKPALKVTHGSNKRSAYRCGNRLFKDGTGHVSREAISLDRLVEQTLVDRLSDPRVLAKLTQKQGSAPADLKALEIDQTAIQRLKEEQAEMHAAGEIDRAQLIAGTKRLEAREKDVTDKLAVAGQRTPLEPLINRKGKTIAEVWYGTGGLWLKEDDRSDGLPLGARRAIIQRVVTITVNKAPRGKHRQPDGDFLDRSCIDFNWKRR
jgi:site-specific DNA recombinase